MLTCMEGKFQAKGMQEYCPKMAVTAILKELQDSQCLWRGMSEKELSRR